MIRRKPKLQPLSHHRDRCETKNSAVIIDNAGIASFHETEDGSVVIDGSVMDHLQTRYTYEANVLKTIHNEEWQQKRDDPEPYIKKALDIFRDIEGEVIVEIGSGSYSSSIFAKASKTFYTCDSNINSSREAYKSIIKDNCIPTTFNQINQSEDPDTLNDLLFTVAPDGWPITYTGNASITEIESNTTYTDKECTQTATVYNGDGLLFLQEFTGKIDLLYLDAWDIGTDKYKDRHYEAYLNCENNLNDKNIILIDDTDVDFSRYNGYHINEKDDILDYNNYIGGKGGVLISHLLQNGYNAQFTGRQTCLTNF